MIRIYFMKSKKYFQSQKQIGKKKKKPNLGFRLNFTYCLAPSPVQTGRNEGRERKGERKRDGGGGKQKSLQNI